MAGFIFSGGAGGGGSSSVTSTGSTTSRTHADRWADITNVKDFGAVGDGVTNDLTAIQAAITAANHGVILTGYKGGTVYFPAGEYYIGTTSGIVAAGFNRLVGEGKESTIIVGNFAGYILDQDGNGGLIPSIEGLYFKNNNPSGGCVRMRGGQSTIIKGCKFSGQVGLDLSVSMFNPIVEGCEFNGSARASGSIGLWTGGSMVSGCSFLGWETGIRVNGISTTLAGSRTESCTWGVVFGGVDADGTNHAGGGLLSGFSTERCGLGVWVKEATELTMSGVDITGTVAGGPLSITSIVRSGATATVTTAVPHGMSGTRHVTIENANQPEYNGYVAVSVTGASTFTYTVAGTPTTPATGTVDYLVTPEYGILVQTATGCVFSGVVVSAYASIAGIDLNAVGAGVGGNSIVFQGVSSTGVDGPAWIMPVNMDGSGHADIYFQGCNNTTAALTFAHLPASPIEGMVFDITDGTATPTVLSVNGGGTYNQYWGATVTGGGSNHFRVRYNGSNWTVVGK